MDERQINEIERLLERPLTPKEKLWLELAEKVSPSNVIPFPDRHKRDAEHEDERRKA